MSLLQTINTDETDMLKATKAFERFLTDFSANKKRLEKIDAAAKELEIIFPDRKKEVSFHNIFKPLTFPIQRLLPGRRRHTKYMTVSSGYR